jgi:hypothetical protein
MGWLLLETVDPSSQILSSVSSIIRLRLNMFSYKTILTRQFYQVKKPNKEIMFEITKKF